MVAWVPTIELSVNIRNIPTTKWLKCIFQTRFITCGLLEEDGETLNPVVAIDPEYEEEILATKIRVDISLTGQSVLAKKGLIFNDINVEPDAFQIPGTPVELEEKIIAVPFIVDDKVLGAIIISRMGINFTEEELALTETYATYASAALKNAQLFNNLQQEVEERKNAQNILYDLNIQYQPCYFE